MVALVVARESSQSIRSLINIYIYILLPVADSKRIVDVCALARLARALSSAAERCPLCRLSVPLSTVGPCRLDSRPRGAALPRPGGRGLDVYEAAALHSRALLAAQARASKTKRL